ncbi:hypothetical protein ACGK9U_04905 [Mariniflexile sp. HNIBRBA6329]|uniref:hypothetical protein n=1 Tax=Mariniflexile sp. HNIBRBA6329 TaxID=3373088 RepID=UPI0037467796
MNKITYLFLTMLLFNYFSFAQEKEDLKDKLFDDIAIGTCECLTRKDLDFTAMEQSKIEMEFGFCILESYGKLKKEADKLVNVSFNDEQSLEQLGVDVAFKMMTHCPDYMTVIAGNYAADEFEEGKDDIILVGHVTNIQESQFNTVELMDTDNRLQKVLWLEYFEGDNLLHDLNKLKKSKVKITCYEFEMFDPRIKEYRNFKIIKKISLL